MRIYRARRALRLALSLLVGSRCHSPIGGLELTQELAGTPGDPLRVHGRRACSTRTAGRALAGRAAARPSSTSHACGYRRRRLDQSRPRRPYAAIARQLGREVDGPRTTWDRFPLDVWPRSWSSPWPASARPTSRRACEADRSDEPLKPPGSCDSRRGVDWHERGAMKGMYMSLPFRASPDPLVARWPSRPSRPLRPGRQRDVATRAEDPPPAREGVLDFRVLATRRGMPTGQIGGITLDPQGRTAFGALPPRARPIHERNALSGHQRFRDRLTPRLLRDPDPPLLTWIVSGTVRRAATDQILPPTNGSERCRDPTARRIPIRPRRGHAAGRRRVLLDMIPSLGQDPSGCIRNLALELGAPDSRTAPRRRPACRLTISGWSARTGAYGSRDGCNSSASREARSSSTTVRCHRPLHSRLRPGPLARQPRRRP